MPTSAPPDPDATPQAGAARGRLGRASDRLANVNIATKVLGVFAIVFLAGAVGVLVQRSGLGALERSVDQALEREQPKAAAAYEMEINAVGFGLAVFKYLEQPSTAYRARAVDERGDFVRFKARYDRLAASDAERRLSREVATLHRDFVGLGARMMDARDREQRRTEAINTAFRRLDHLLDERLELGRNPLVPGASPRILAAGVLEQQLVEFGTWLHSYLLSGDPAALARVFNNARDVRNGVRALQVRLSSARGRADLAAFKREWRALYARARAAIAAREQAHDDARALVDLRTLLDELLDDEIQIHAARGLQRASASTRDRLTGILRSSALLLALVAAACGAAALAIRRAIVDPIQRLSEGANAIGSGDLAHRIIPKRDDELGGLARRFNEMAGELDATTVSKRLLEESEGRLQVTLDSIGDGVITTGVDGRVLYLNPVAEALTGWPAAESAGRPLAEVFEALDEVTREPIDGARTGAAGLPKLLVRRDGTEFTIKDSSATIYDRDGASAGVVLVFRDVTDERAAARQLAYQASHDPLTGLANRREFERRLELLIESARETDQRHVLCYLDLDQFKIVNDTCGHAAGDELLQRIAAALLRRTRSSDTLARLGGDEFGVLLHDCSPEAGMHLAEGLLGAFERFFWEDRSFEVGVSIGVVSIDANTRSVGEVMSAADTACYEAKDKGRNRVQLYSAEDADLIRRRGEMEWVSRITQAIEQDRFVLYRQTIAPLTHASAPDGDRFELLLRMIDERGEIVGPDSFLPAAARYDLMPMIDRTVVARALAALAAHYGNDGYRRLASASINLSGATLGDDLFLQFVENQFALHGVPPPKVCFEITETAAVHNLAEASELIRALRAAGCRFAMDDFGSGVSSLVNLRSLPVDHLKIDGALVREIVRDEIAYSMVGAVAQIARVMDIQTTGEFAETERIVTALAGLGVNYAQGFAIGHPIPLEGDLPAARHSIKPA